MFVRKKKDNPSPASCRFDKLNPVISTKNENTSSLMHQKQTEYTLPFHARDKLFRKIRFGRGAGVTKQTVVKWHGVAISTHNRPTDAPGGGSLGVGGRKGASHF